MTDKKEMIRELQDKAKHMRITGLKMANRCGGNAHIGGAMSLMEIMAALYGAVMNTSDKSLSYAERDKFILSKGHGVLALYTALAEFGLMDGKTLDTFMADGSDLIAHPVMKPELGIEASSGSLGQGISMAVGMALAAKLKGYAYKTFVVCGNGESNEGSVWEACMSAVNFKLDNFSLVIDNNHMQSDGQSESIMNISDRYTEMLKALGFQTFEIDGNDVEQVLDALKAPHNEGMPKAIIGNTIKGKGISFMENNNEWHHNRLTADQLEAALRELEADV